YTVAIRNDYGAVTSSVATLSVLFPVSITSQPKNVAMTNGGTASFEIEITGSPPVRYQWLFQGTNLLAGETNPVLTLPNISPAHAGAYTVEASNDLGAARSVAATLTVLLPPTILVQPQSWSVVEGNAI